MSEDVDLADEAEPKLRHVMPAYGREHVALGFTCWCHPERHPEYPNVVMHHEEQ